MTPELERLLEEFNIELRLLGWEIDTIVQIDGEKIVTKIGGGTKNPK